MPTPKVWGKFEWFTLHCEAAAFPENASEEKRNDFVSYITNKAKFLPCGICSYHMSKYLEENPIYPATESREKLQRYFYDFHNAVNDRKNVPKEKRPSYEEVKAAFSPSNLWPGLGEYPMPPETPNEEKNIEVKGHRRDKSMFWIVLFLVLIFAAFLTFGIVYFAKKGK